MQKPLSLQGITGVTLAVLIALMPAVSEAARSSARPDQWSDDELAKIGERARNNLNKAIADDIDCMPWDKVWEDAASALSAWAIFDTDNFCGEEVVLDRNEGVVFSLSGTGLPSDFQCAYRAGLVDGHGRVTGPVVERSVEVRSKWRLQRRGQTGKVACDIDFQILD